MARHCRYEMSILVTAMGGVARFATRDGEIALTPQEIWDGKVPGRSLLTRIEVPLTAGLRLDYERSLRPIMTQALALWTDAGGGPCGRAVIATEYLRPLRWSSTCPATPTPAASLRRPSKPCRVTSRTRRPETRISGRPARRSWPGSSTVFGEAPDGAARTRPGADLHAQRRAGHRRRDDGDDLGGPAARAARSARHQALLFALGLRRLHRAGRRPAGRQLRDLCLRGRGRRRPDRRGRRRRRGAGRRAGCVRRQFGLPVWLLHVRHDHADRGAARDRPRSRRGDDQGLDQLQRLPLHRLHPDHRGGPRCRRRRKAAQGKGGQ